MGDNDRRLSYMVCFQSFVAIGTTPDGQLSGWELTR